MPLSYNDKYEILAAAIRRINVYSSVKAEMMEVLCIENLGFVLNDLVDEA